MKTLLYLHGFLSSPASAKATRLADHLRGQAPGVHLVVPQLSHDPRRAIDQASEAVSGIAAGDLTVVGSSLGGFYATVLAERLGCRAVLVNPAVHPQRLFAGFLGPQKNLYTGEAFELTHDHVNALQALDPPRITRPERYWLLVETGDEVLDYRQAVDHYTGARQDVIPGGDHTLRSFPEHLPGIVAWATAALAPASP